MAETQTIPQGNPINDLMAEGEAHDNNAAVPRDAVDEALSGPEEGFDYEALDRSVSPLVYDNVETQPEQVESPQEVTSQETQTQVGPDSQKNIWEQEDNPYKKRYSDSSREIQKIKAEQKDLQPFVPVLEAMKRDSGLVEHVRDYLQNGGKPAKSIKESLELPDDFIYDQAEAIEDPESDSGKLFNAHVDKAVEGRVKQLINNERQHAAAARNKAEKDKQVAEFKKKRNISEEEYQDMVNWAKDYKMTIDDIYALKNKDKMLANNASATKADMMQQMERVQNFPTSTATENSVRVEKSPDDSLFESLLDLDSSDNLFG